MAGLTACLILSACQPAPEPPLDLGADPDGSFACGARPRCWSDPAGAAWARDDDVMRSPRFEPRQGEVLVLRLRSTTPVAVELAGRPEADALAQLEPARPWSPQLFSVPLPPASEPVAVQLRPVGRRSPRQRAPELVFAEILPAGRGRCYREHRWADRRLVAVAACVGPARAELPVSQDARSLEVVTHGSAQGPWQLSIEGDAVQERLEVPEGEGWREERIPLAQAAERQVVSFGIDGPVGALLVWSPRAVAPPASASRPNVLVYLVDTLRADALGAYGAEHPTRHFDALAREGVVFEQALSPSSWTLPSVMSLLTGRDPTGHGVVDHRDALEAGIPTLAERFRQDGRATAAVTASLWATDRHGAHRGFQDLWEVSPERGPWGVRAGTTSADANAHVLPWLERHADERFFLYVHVADPHQPYTPPEELVPARLRTRWPPGDPRWRMARAPTDGRGGGGRSSVEALGPERRAPILGAARELYDAAVLHCDGQLGRILATLERLGLRDRTLVVVTADHGEEFGEHARTGHAHSLYAELTRVPLILSQPGRLAPGLRIPSRVGLVDVAATLLELAGASSGPGFPGASLAPWLAGDGAPAENASGSALRLHHRPQNEERPIPGIPDMDAIVVGRWKLIRNRGRGSLDRAEWELFDLALDPGETRNRAEGEPEVRDRLAARLAAMERADGTTTPGSAGPLDDETRERLRALGYLVEEDQSR